MIIFFKIHIHCSLRRLSVVSFPQSLTVLSVLKYLLCKRNVICLKTQSACFSNCISPSDKSKVLFALSDNPPDCPTNKSLLLSDRLSYYHVSLLAKKMWHHMRSALTFVDIRHSSQHQLIWLTSVTSYKISAPF